MKININKINIFICALFFVLLIFNHKIYGAAASLTGNTTVRSGDTITLNLKISAKGSYGVETSLQYDSNIVELKTVTTSLNNWVLERNGSKIILYDDKLSNPLNNDSTIIKATFKVKNVSAGTAINISFNGITASDGSKETNIGNVAYSVKVAQPLSGNNNLSSLSIKGFNIDFNSNKTEYDLGTVEYSTSELTITGIAQDKSAIVSYSGIKLSVGYNTAKIVVKAANGTTKTYTIKVVRKQDPDYVASNNADLSSISVSDGRLSPSFSASVTDYVVYLPFESKNININGTAADAKAVSVEGSSSDNLKTGENKLTVTVTAEDGTKKIYNISVFVMPEYKGTVPQIPFENKDNNETTTENKETETVENITSFNEDDDLKNVKQVENHNTDISTIKILIIVIIALSAGFLLCFVLFKSKVIKV